MPLKLAYQNSEFQVGTRFFKTVNHHSNKTRWRKMDYEKLFTLEKPIIKKKDQGAAHTSRVHTIAKENT